MHDDYVFVYRRERVKNIDKEPVMPYDRIETMNNTGIPGCPQGGRLGGVRVHDLRHTFGQRLREAGVQEEDRALLLGHARRRACRSTTPRRRSRVWSSLANKVTRDARSTTLLRVING